MSMTREFYSESGQRYIISDESTHIMGEWKIYKVINGETVHIGTIIEAGRIDEDYYNVDLEHTKDGHGRHITTTKYVPSGMKYVVEAHEREWEQ